MQKNGYQYIIDDISLESPVSILHISTALSLINNEEGHIKTYYQGSVPGTLQSPFSQILIFSGSREICCQILFYYSMQKQYLLHDFNNNFFFLMKLVLTFLKKSANLID